MRFRWLSLLCCSALLLSITTSAQIIGKPEVRHEVYRDTSPPLREMPDAQRGHVRWEREPMQFKSRPSSGGVDTAIQTQQGPAVNTTPGVSFQGVGVGFTGPQGSFTPNAAPPDTNGAVGPNHYVQWVNESFAIFSKTGTPLVGPKAGNSIWSGFGGLCQSDNDGDPIVQYDKQHDRWILTQFAVTGATSGSYLQCIAVSTTGDPTGSYNRYAFAFTDFPDYPKLGVWPDGYYMSFNMFRNGQTFDGAGVCAFNDAQMRAGQSAQSVCFQTSTAFGGLLPSDVDGQTQPPAGSPNYFVAFGTSPSSQLQIWQFHVDWTNTGNSTFSGPTTVGVASFSEACGGGTCIPQAGTTNQLDSLGDRLMYRLAYRNFGDHESLVVNHSVTAGSAVGVRWYEIRNPGGTGSNPPVIFQQSTFAPDTTSFRWMGSVAMDKVGNMAMGYSISGGGLDPSIRYTGRQVSDPLSTMEAENVLFGSSFFQSGSLHRWGDYSSISVDPVDDCTFWYTTEYEPASGSFNWATKVFSFSFPNCATPTPPAAPTGLTASGGASKITLNWNASTGATSYNVLRSTSTGTETQYATSATNSFTDNSVSTGTTYFYVVQAVNSAGTSGNSNEASAAPLSPPAAPTNLVANGGQGNVGLNWNASTGATSYNILRSTTTGTETQYATSGTNSFTDTGVVAGTTYFYVVQAVNAAGASGNSNEASGTPTAPPPPGTFSISAASTSVTVPRGGSITDAITITGSNNYTGTVNLTVTGAAQRTNASLSPTSVGASNCNATCGTSTLTISANRPATSGMTYTLTVTGNDGKNSHSVQISVRVQ